MSVTASRAWPGDLTDPAAAFNAPPKLWSARRLGGREEACRCALPENAKS